MADRRRKTYARERDSAGRPRNARPRDRFGRPLPRGAPAGLDRVEPERVVAGPDDAFERAVALFDDARFFEAHEYFELIWKHADTDPEDRDFWKGVTQVAVGCVHTQRGNASGALTLLGRARHHLAPYPGEHNGVDVTALVQAAGMLAARIRRDGPSPALQFPSFPRARDQD